jgi:hypothetical protein
VDIGGYHLGWGEGVSEKEEEKKREMWVISCCEFDERDEKRALNVKEKGINLAKSIYWEVFRIKI